LKGLSNSFFLDAACNDIMTTAAFTNGLLLVLFVIDGTLWPLEALPEPVLYMSACFPITSSLRGILARG